MHALSYHLPIFIRDPTHSSNSLDRVWKKTTMMQNVFFFQKSNKWDAARDVLHLEARQQALGHSEREKRNYEKRKN